MAAIFATMVARWNLGLPCLVVSPEAPIHARIEALEQFNRDTPLLVPDQAWWRANPLGMLWPEMEVAFVASGANAGGSPPATARRPVAVVAAS